MRLLQPAAAAAAAAAAAVGLDSLLPLLLLLPPAASVGGSSAARTPLLGFMGCVHVGAGFRQVEGVPQTCVTAQHSTA